MTNSAHDPGSSPGTYVYGVTTADVTIEAPGMGGGGTPVRLLPSGDLAALVSDVPDEVAVGARALRAHARVLDAALERGPVVPLQFGTILENDREVVEDVLDAHREHLTHLLHRFSQCVELSVRATYKEDLILRDLLAANPKIARLHEKVAGIDPDATYYARIQLGEQIITTLEARRDHDAETIYRQLTEIADDVQVGEPLNSHMVVNGAFLVDRAHLDAFDHQVDAVARSHPMTEVRYVGPLPPYSFSDLEMAG